MTSPSRERPEDLRSHRWTRPDDLRSWASVATEAGEYVGENLIDDVLALPPGDRLELVRRLWESNCEDAIHLPLTDVQEQELDRRYEEFLDDPAEGSSWEEVEAFVQAKLRA